MPLKKHEIEKIIEDWMVKFNDFNLSGVMACIHDDIIFENWDDSTIIGKKLLYRAWRIWFKSKNFNFKTINIHIDPEKQTAILEWQLNWSINNINEFRKGVDILFFHNDKIILKKTFSKISRNNT